MSIINVAALRKNLYGIVESVARYNKAVTVTSKAGNVVIVSESEYNAMSETIYLMSAPGLHRELTKAKASKYIDYDPKQEW